ncbi:type I polyketide synthase [Paracidovorax konjaci]|uniref:Phenolphthiocerol/phthiocerol polyketide synthase subunit E n=1 Tax=Paracidovorax konjaci TaxID=32040 RepID=A0A1I1SMR7_9BURK|nr:type I polyketide synthase [Paracidovorax konjaci]SFD47774.1 Acyl transferase domain-containing protein [Paracidovorax konjaci]
MNTLSSHEPGGLEIAIVGMAGRFPGAPDIDTFWQRIRDGVESVKHYTDEELAALGVPESLRNDPDYVKAGMPLDGVDRFDAEFFGFTPREAEQLDPQQRLFLESAWACLEHAGCDTSRWQGKVGVYGGEGPSVYLMRHLLPSSGLDGGAGIADVLGLMGANAGSSLCTRVAYKLDLRGPAVTVQTACSTSLMAVHMACQALLGHECDMALAGGVWLNLLQQGGYRYQAGAILSPDGHCRAFDAKAAGTVVGSGAGTVALKRLDDALRDGDTVHAVIKGSAANNDGSAKVGFTAPSVDGQAEVIRAAQLIAGVSADTIGYIEAHGTGTALGDPIEIAALTQAFRSDTERHGFCAVGSVKTNVGHLDAAAGVAGLIKAAMALKHRQLPPSLHWRKPHPQIDFAASPFYVNTEAKPWPQGAFPRRAGVSSFGIGGTNVHVVLEEAQANTVPVEPMEGAWHVLPVSARTEPALRESRLQLAAHLLEQPVAELADVAHTLQSGRRAWSWRAAVVAHEPGLAAQRLQAPLPSPVRVAGTPAEVVFLFPGAGSQHVGMARDLYRRHAVFRRSLDECADILRRETGLELCALIHPPAGEEAAAAERLARIDASQPALFAVEYALAQWWMSCGVQPDLMLGHSLGEYVAACIAGVFSLEDAMRIVAWRGQLMATLVPGAMTSVSLPEPEVAPFLVHGCDLAAVNGDAVCVLAGTPDAVERTEQALREQGHLPRRVHVSVASHSRLVEPIVAELERRIASVPRQVPRLPFISNVTGKRVTAEEATSPAYWGRHLRGTVRFRDGLDTVLSQPGRVVLEVGPGEALAGLARQHAAAASAAGIWASQAHPQQQERNGQQLAHAVAGLWMAGVDIGWSALRDGAPRRSVPLPTYPFQRQRFWVDAGPRDPSVRHPGQADAAPGGMYYAPCWRRGNAAQADPAAAGPAHGDTVLMYAGNGLPLADRLAAVLKERGARVVRVQAADAFLRTGSDSYGLRPDHRADHAALWRDAGAISHVFHFWGVGGGEPVVSPPQSPAWELGYFSLMALAQGLEDAGAMRALSLTVVTDCIDEVAGTEELVPEKATLLGIAKVMGQEMPHVACRVVDVILPRADSVAEGQLARALADEPTRSAEDFLVAWRGAHRWVKAYEPTLPPPVSAQRLRPGSVVVITGGLGGVGLALARYLGRTHGARLVLTGRTPLPPRPTWPQLLAQRDLPSAQRRRLEQLQALDAQGIAWLDVAADTTDPMQWRAALDAIHARFGPVNGVIHAVVEPGRGMLATRTREQAEAAFAPKVRGTQALLEAVRGEPLDFVLLCSSVASLIGGLGRSDYAAANAYLDAFATLCRREYEWPVFSVNWDAWRDVGIAVDMDVPEGLGLDEKTGAAVFERIVNGPAVPQTVVSVTPLAQRLKPLDGLVDSMPDVPEAGPALDAGHPRPVLSTPYRAPEEGVESDLAALWTEALGIDGLGADDNLFELGGDSLLAIRLLSRVRKTYGVEIHPASFFKAPTVSELAQLVELRLIEDIEREASGASQPEGRAATLQTE